MITKLEKFQTEDGLEFDSLAEAEAHESIATNYDLSLKELKELLTKAQILLDTKPELTKLRDYMSSNCCNISIVLSNINDYDGEKDEHFNYYTSNC